MVIAIVILIVITLVIPINYHSYSMVYNYPAKSLQSCNSPGTTAKRQLLPRQPGFSLPVEVDFLKVDVDGCDA